MSCSRLIPRGARRARWLPCRISHHRCRWPPDWRVTDSQSSCCGSGPSRSFVLPRVIQAGLVGGSAPVATVAGLRRPRLVAQALALAGIVLMGWILGEVLIVRSSVAQSWLEAGYRRWPADVRARVARVVVDHRRPTR